MCWQAAFVQLDSAVVSLPGMALKLNMISAEDLLLMLIISVIGVDFRAQLWLLPWQASEDTCAHTHAWALRTLWGQRPGMTYFDYSVLKQQVMGFPGCHLCRWPLFRDSIQDPGRAGWQHARSTSELSYHWHQVSRRCHVFILWEFNPPFRMDQALCRWREGCADKCSHTSSRECLANNLWGTGMLNKGCFIGDHEAIHFPNLLVS